ncbi:hypothetical protein GCM10009665_71120 [Kitasatospora nipponensis]|uniref:Uncharacterized protein n=1 Tax=Kitasatospora nipponensis TaxID=258049 RepID=A0ABP4HQ27_9ACTN
MRLRRALRRTSTGPCSATWATSGRPRVAVAGPAAARARRGDAEGWESRSAAMAHDVTGWHGQKSAAVAEFFSPVITNGMGRSNARRIISTGLWITGLANSRRWGRLSSPKEIN